MADCDWRHSGGALRLTDSTHSICRLGGIGALVRAICGWSAGAFDYLEQNPGQRPICVVCGAGGRVRRAGLVVAGKRHDFDNDHAAGRVRGSDLPRPVDPNVLATGRHVRRRRAFNLVGAPGLARGARTSQRGDYAVQSIQLARICRNYGHAMVGAEQWLEVNLLSYAICHHRPDRTGPLSTEAFWKIRRRLENWAA